MKAALAYMRTSSATNVGADKDSERRQRTAIEAFAKRGKFQIAEWYYDPAVKGSDAIEGRPGFKALLEHIAGNGARVVIVEDASRFARHLLTQEAGIALLVGMGVRVLTANGDDLTDSDDEFRVAMRQMLGVFSQLEKTRLVKKLRSGRERAKKLGKPAGGQRPHTKLRPAVVAEAKRLRAIEDATGKRMSMRRISAELAAAGHVNERGQAFNVK